MGSVKGELEIVLKIPQGSYNKNLMYVSVQFKLQLNSPDRKKLLELVRNQSSAIRSALFPVLGKVLPRDLSLFRLYWWKPCGIG